MDNISLKLGTTKLKKDLFFLKVFSCQNVETELDALLLRKSLLNI